MEALFLKLFNMSITASWLVLAVVILRLLLKKAPKTVTVFLWAFVGIRLVCPFSFESVLSIIPSAETVPEAMLAGSDFNIDTGLSAVDSRINGYLDDRYIEGVTVPAGNGMTVMGVLSAIWLAGIAAMLIYTLISYFKIHRKIREAVPYNENIWVCDRISAPFILGVFRPKIYLPSAIDKQDAEYVIAHERAHLKRRDHLIKPLGFLLLTVYWFNPVMWIAYILLCRDIELACDEKVIKTMGIEIKKPYSEALINCSLPRRAIAACPLAFGEVGVKSRIKSVLNYKKPAFWIIAAALALCAILPVFFLTNPISATVNNIINEKNYIITSQEKYNVTLTVPKSVINESAYTEKGQKFKKNEVIAYQTNTTTVYLQKISVSKRGDEELLLTFNCSYRSIDKNNSILLPYTKINNGIASCVGLNSGDSEKDNVSVWSSGPDEQFGYSISKEEIDNSHEDIKIYAFINRLTYSKKGEETQTEPTDGLLIFYETGTDEHIYPVTKISTNFNDADFEKLLKALKNLKWNDDWIEDRTSFIFNGKLYRDGWIYFGYEQKIAYYDHYYALISDDIIGLIKSYDKSNAESAKTYEFTESEDIYKPSITLFDNGEFEFTFSALSSYIGFGKYESDGARLTLKTDDGEYIYVFDIVGDTLVFDAEASSDKLWGSGLHNGAVFNQMKSSNDSTDNETDSSSSKTGNYNPYFNATVLEVYENSVLVEPFEDSNERKSADKITVNTNVISTHPVPELKNGMQIRIVYNGTIEETYPANIPTAFAIYELREIDGKLEPVIATPLQSEATTSLIDSDIKEIYVLSRPSKGQIDKFTVSKTYTDNKLKQLKAFLTTEYCEEKEADT